MSVGTGRPHQGASAQRTFHVLIFRPGEIILFAVAKGSELDTASVELEQSAGVDWEARADAPFREALHETLSCEAGFRVIGSVQLRR
jgi:hypothetical protein